jgi:hypothetical protein
MFAQPQVLPGEDVPLNRVGLDANVRIKKNNEEVLCEYERVGPDLYLQGEEGITYSGRSLLFYSYSRKKLIFDGVETYGITVRKRTKTSNRLDITVSPASARQKTFLSLLSDPKDYAFLQGGAAVDPQRLKHLEQVVEECAGTPEAAWAAARLGLEYFQRFHRKHPSFERFKDQYQSGQVEEPLFEKASKYLRIGAELPKAFPIRAKVLRDWGRIQMTEGDFQEALATLEELNTEYKDTEYGIKAAKWKDEVFEVQRRESAPLAESAPSHTFLLLSLGIVAGAAVILAVYLAKRHAARSK